MDQIPVKTHKSNYDDKTAQFNLAAVKMLQLSPAQLRVLAWYLAGDWDARVTSIRHQTSWDERHEPDASCDIGAQVSHSIRHRGPGNQVRWGQITLCDNVTVVTWHRSWHVTQCHEYCHDQDPTSWPAWEQTRDHWPGLGQPNIQHGAKITIKDCPNNQNILL